MAHTLVEALDKNNGNEQRRYKKLLLWKVKPYRKSSAIKLKKAIAIRLIEDVMDYLKAMVKDFNDLAMIRCQNHLT
jgi:hypothetical protein